MERIAIFIPSLSGGGAQRVMLNLAKGLSDKNYKIDLVVVKLEGQYINQVPKNIKLISLNSRYAITSLFPLIKYLKTNKPDILISAMAHVNVVAIISKILTRKKTKLIITEHTTLSLAKKESKKVKEKVLFNILKYIYNYADAIVAVSKYMAHDMSIILGIPEEKINVIYNPIIDNSLIEKSNQDIEEEWFNPNESPVVISIGRLAEPKDFETLIRAFKKVRDKMKVRLLILGEGPKREQLEKLIHDLNIENDVKMPGFKQNPYAYLRRAALFVLSSKREGLPTVLVEALACGIPVISTDCLSGPREILQNGRLGTLVPVGDVDALAKAIELNLNNINNIRNRISLNDLKEFTFEKSIQNYIKLIRSVLND